MIIRFKDLLEVTVSKFNDLIDVWEELDEFELLDEKFNYGKTKKGKEVTPEQHLFNARRHEEGKQFHIDHPAHHMNIVDHFNKATPEEHENGMNWYSDAHHFNKVMAKDTGVNRTQMAGLVANYSPQTHWHTNLLTAARVARHGRGVGGKGSGYFATDKQRGAAERILGGDHYNNVLAGHKVRAFAHLVEHGESQTPEHPHVVVDRHAHSVASGHRLTDSAFGHAGLKGQKKYQQISDMYRDAAKHLSEVHGRKIHPHQVQAVTWLVRQRLNQEEDKAMGKKAKGNAAAKAAKATAEWDKYKGEHHHDLVGHKGAGVGYNAAASKD